ncbi:molybdopterin-dependent oxidoreductase [Chloroflexota bacterium]
MVTKRVVKSACGFCNAACGVIIHIENGVPVRVEGDKDDPTNRGALCAKGHASIEFFNHPDRLKYPLKRLGEKGEGKWQRISWDEALDIIASKLMEIKDKYGAESTVFVAGGYKGGISEGLIVKLAAAYGTPNIVRTSTICHVPRIMASRLTYGFNAVPNYDYTPACIVSWGANKCETFIPSCKGILSAHERGSRLIVIDPRETELAKRADIWIKLRPSTDLALALGMHNVIINEGLFEKDFVDKWTVGFDEFKSLVQNYPPEKAEEITWVPAEMIKEVARLYARSKPACIQWGNGLDHNINNFQSARAIACLRAITGNLAIPGGDIHRSPSGAVLLQSLSESFLNEMVPESMMQKRLSAGDKLLPLFPYSSAQAFVKSILNEDPYPVHAAYLMGASPLHTYSHGKETYEALKKLEFLVATDLFMTPTAALADMVLPVTSYLEHDSVYEPDLTGNSQAQIQQKVIQVGECWSEWKIMLELAKRLGLKEKGIWDDEKDLLDYLVKPSGLTFEEAKRVGVISRTQKYRFYEDKGFDTPSGKVELFSERLEKWGFDPLPIYHEPPETPYSAPEMAGEYPLIFTNWKSTLYQHSQGKQINILRNGRPEPLIEIHPETAGKLGIKEGDWVYIENKRGRIKQKACFSNNIDHRVVFVDFGWWFPEKGAFKEYGWAESNVNILTDNKKPYAREMGSATLRGILCKVYKCEEETE